MMPTMPFSSPHRKRESPDSICDSPPASPASPPSPISIASLQEARLREEEDFGSYSPRAAVAGRLGELAIQGDYPPSFSQSSGSLYQEAKPLLHADCWDELCNDLDDMTGCTSVDPSGSGLNAPPEGNHSRLGHESTAAPAPASPAKKESLMSPRKRKTATATAKMCQKRGSPPPDSAMECNPFTWHDSEITGHNPTDPNDDGYGINGIGFKPTAAIAWARSQKRQRQVAEWKTREAREAREKRRERRDGINLDKIRSIQSGSIQKKVKFNL